MLKSKDVENMVRDGLKGMKAYTPVDPVEVLTGRAGVPAGQTVKLDGNENPYGCSPRVQKALAEFQDYNGTLTPTSAMCAGHWPVTPV